MTITDSDSFLAIFIVSSSIVVICVLLIVFRLFVRSGRGDYKFVGSELIAPHDLPYEFLNDEESLLVLGHEYDYEHLSPEDQRAYRSGEEFTQANPPHFHNTRGRSYTVEDDNALKDMGIRAFEFDQDERLDPRYMVADKTELNFFNNDLPYSTVTSVLNHSLPVKNRNYSDTIYFETKVFEFDHTNPNAHFAIGLVTRPYPKFRLPGYNNFSIAYESTGNLKINKPFPTPLQQHLGDNSLYNALVLPPLSQSDVVGFGYHVLSGTVFITRNGRKLMDVMKGIFVDLYPAVGCFSTNAKLNVNLGQLGFVWIEANVRKYGFVSTSDYKKIGGERGLTALPQYGSQAQISGDKLLDKGEELPPKYPEDEFDFFGRSVKDIYSEGTSSQAQRNLEEKAESEEEVKEHNSTSVITHEPEEVMDLRERIYEQNITAPTDDDNDTTPLISIQAAGYGADGDAEATKETPSSHSTSTNEIVSSLAGPQTRTEQGSRNETESTTSPQTRPKKKNKKKKKTKRK